MFLFLEKQIYRMEVLEIDLPKKIIIGERTLEKVGGICKEIGLRNSATLFTGSNIVNVAGKKVLEVLESNGYKVELRIIPERFDKSLMNLKNDGFTVGVGGGRSIDIAKMAAKTNKIPFISIPTAISHDGIASNRAVIETWSIPAVIPTAIIIDTDIIMRSPYRLTAAGCGDMVAKLTAIADWELSNKETGEYISEYVAEANKASANLIIRSAESIRKLEIKGLRTLIESLVFSGISMSIAGSSRPASGSEHLFSHALKLMYPNKTSLHGEECGIGTILCSYLHEMDWQRIAKALKTIGAPTNSQELGIPDEIIIKALCKARDVRKDRYTILNYKAVDERKAKEAAKETGIIP